MQLRRDWLDPVGLYHTAGRQRLATTREDEVGQTMAGVHAQTEIEWARTLRTTLGLRADVYRLLGDVRQPAQLWRRLGRSRQSEVRRRCSVRGRGNGDLRERRHGFSQQRRAGRGRFAWTRRAASRSIRVTPLVRARGAEVGLRTVRVRGLQSTVTLWYLGLDSELLFVGDAGTTEAGRPSRRVGVEWTNYARADALADRWMVISRSHARFTDDDPAGDFIPGALDRVISAGVTVEAATADLRQPSRASLRPPSAHRGRQRHVQQHDAVERSRSVWRLSGKARLVLEMFNIFDADVSDIDYFYASRLPGEPVAGIEDMHPHPALPRSARLGLQVGF